MVSNKYSNLSAPREILDVESSLTNESLGSSDIIGGYGSLNWITKIHKWRRAHIGGYLKLVYFLAMVMKCARPQPLK